MKEMVFEWLICILCASVLMIIHEMVKTAIYLLQKRRMHQKAAFSHSMWAVYRYIDPIGLILAVVSNVPFSKPFMFRVRDKKTNLVMGISGFCILVAVFALCICSLHFDLFGLDSILQQDPNCLWAKGGERQDRRAVDRRVGDPRSQGPAQVFRNEHSGDRLPPQFLDAVLLRQVFQTAHRNLALALQAERIVFDFTGPLPPCLVRPERKIR